MRKQWVQNSLTLNTVSEWLLFEETSVKKDKINLILKKDSNLSYRLPTLNLHVDKPWFNLDSVMNSDILMMIQNSCPR